MIDLSQYKKSGMLWVDAIIKELEELRAVAKEMSFALMVRSVHDDDCLDKDDIFNEDEMCECGANVAAQALAKYSGP